MQEARPSFLLSPDARLTCLSATPLRGWSLASGFVHQTFVKFCPPLYIVTQRHLENESLPTTLNRMGLLNGLDCRSWLCQRRCDCKLSDATRSQHRFFIWITGCPDTHGDIIHGRFSWIPASFRVLGSQRLPVLLDSRWRWDEIMRLDHVISPRARSDQSLCR